MIQQLKYFSMFSGIGGFEYGIQQALPNAECVGYSEIDKYSIQTYEKHYKHKNYGDATRIKPEELSEFDMLCGGFPCQAFSVAGKRRGFEDTRGTLFFEIARILEVKRPKIILLENVKGLLNHNKGETFRTIIQTLSELGYDVQWMVLNSKFFGVPQNRERVFIIGSLRGECRPEILPFGEVTDETCKHINQINKPTHSNDRIYEDDGLSPALNTAQGENRQPKIIDVYNKRMRNEIPALTDPCHNNIRLAEARAVLTPDRPTKRQNGRRMKDEGEPSFTLTGQDIHGVAIAHCIDANYWKGNSPSHREQKRTRTEIVEGMKIRRLTPTECERLQGFPDGWTEGVSDTQRYKQCGNAVTTKVIKSIIEQLIVGKFTQNSTSSGFPTENSPNMRYQEKSADFSQMPNGTSDNANIIGNFKNSLVSREQLNINR